MAGEPFYLIGGIIAGLAGATAIAVGITEPQRYDEGLAEGMRRAIPAHVAYGDVNEDGRGDIVTYDSEGKVRQIFLQKKNGVYVDSKTILEAERSSASSSLDQRANDIQANAEALLSSGE